MLSISTYKSRIKELTIAAQDSAILFASDIDFDSQNFTEMDATSLSAYFENMAHAASLVGKFAESVRLLELTLMKKTE